MSPHASTSTLCEKVAKILNLLGYVQYEFGSLLAALKSMEEALEIQRDCSGCDEDVAVTLSNMGFLYAKSGKYAEATSVLRKALGIQRRVLSESHPRTIVTRNNLSHVLSLKSDSVVFIKVSVEPWCLYDESCSCFCASIFSRYLC